MASRNGRNGQAAAPVASRATQVEVPRAAPRPRAQTPVRIVIEAPKAVGRKMAPGEIVAHYLVPGVAIFLAVLLFLSAHGNIDATNPNVNSARTNYLLVAGLAVVVLGAGVALALRSHLWAAAGAAAGIPLAFWLQDQGGKIGGYWCSGGRAPTSSFFVNYPCDPSADIAGTVWLFALGLAAAGGIAAGVFAGMKRSDLGHATFLATGLGIVVAFGIASVLLMPGLEERAAAAAELNRPQAIPGPGLALVAAAVALVAWLRRR